MKHILLISCLILCSCLVQEEAEPETSPLPDTSSDLSSSSSPSDLPSSSSSQCRPIVFETASLVEPDPLILECPPEDIAEFPVLDIPDDWCVNYRVGGCIFDLQISKKELSFNAQGGVRCITTDRSFGLFGGYDQDNHFMLKCITEEEIERMRTYEAPYWRILKCPGDEPWPPNVVREEPWPSEYPWLTATIVDTRILHISVNKNETGSERKLYIHPSCQTSFSITQSAD